MKKQRVARIVTSGYLMQTWWQGFCCINPFNWGYYC